jgi:gamma-glutamyltranspeptidase/glutathione hydrolase/leukotriene-C4 hydrolase
MNRFNIDASDEDAFQNSDEEQGEMPESSSSSSRRRITPHTPFHTMMNTIGVMGTSGSNGTDGWSTQEYGQDIDPLIPSVNKNGAADSRKRMKNPIHIYHPSYRKGSRMKHWLHVGVPTAMILCLIVTTIVLTIVFNVRSVVVEQALKVSHAAVASDSPLCAVIGKNIMKNLKGNAVDAVIATALCQGVVRPFASGIGGGGFMTIHMAKPPVRRTSASDSTLKKINDFINFREKAPEKSTRDMFDGQYEKSVTGALSVAVPGEVAGMWEAHQTYGSLPWESLFTDAIQLARYGFKIDSLFAKRLQQSKQAIFNSPTLRKVFTKKNAASGSDLLLEEGDLLKRPEYANTLEKIAREGPKAFYEGYVAESIVNQIQSNGGIMTLDDLRNYNVERVRKNPDALVKMENVTSNFQEFKVVTGPPPSSGVIINFMLNILDNFELNVPSDAFDYAQKYHYILESIKFGLTHRMALGDRMSPQNISHVLADHILSTKYAKYLSDFKIQSQTTYPWKHYLFDGYFAGISDQGTTHISVIDEQRNAVAFTSTINHSFGSKLYNLETGVLLNNEMNDFTIDLRENEFGILPSSANWIEPGKRPQSSQAPTILLDKEDNVRMVIGGSGGPTILSSIIQVIVSIHNFHLDTYNSVNMPRFHTQPPHPQIYMEEGIVRIILEGLKSRGHEFQLTSTLVDGHSIGNVQVVRVTEKNILEAASDKRKNGEPSGY